MDALYIHIPFCAQICAYCDFAKEITNTDKRKTYMKHLFNEIKSHEDELSNIHSIFIGGGTPSILDEEDLSGLFNTLKAVGLKDVEDITIEANPSDVTPSFANLLKRLGVSRVSLGAQSFNERQLTFLKRTHAPKDIRHAVDNLKNSGIFNINLDMLFGIPYQSLDALNHDIDCALALDVTHISYYSVIIEENTALSLWIEKGMVEPVSEFLEAEMFETVIQRLQEEGFKHYEISNFALPGFQSIHNTMVWKSEDYLGVGTGAHSKWRNKRFYNVRRIKEYNERMESDLSPIEAYYPYEPMRDFLLMGMRRIEGIELSEFKARFGVEVLEAFPQLKESLDQGLIHLDSHRLNFTYKGLFLGNEVFMKL